MLMGGWWIGLAHPAAVVSNPAHSPKTQVNRYTNEKVGTAGTTTGIPMIFGGLAR